MSCERPILLKNPQGGTFYAICGTCRSCLISDITSWSIRLKNENKHALTAYFITLTYSDDFNDDILHKNHVQEFFKNLRNNVRTLPKEKPIKYMAVGEYGEQTERPHYHAIVFNIPAETPIKAKQLIARSWIYGNIVVGEVNDKTINYTCKYIFKQKYWKGEKPKPFRMFSTRPAIGSDYCETHLDYHYLGERFYYNEHGVKKQLPRYYRKKMFDDDMQEKFIEQTLEYVKERHEKTMSLDAKQNIRAAQARHERQKMTNDNYFNKLHQTERL